MPMVFFIGCKQYEMCSKSIEPLIGIYILIDLEVRNLNPLQSRPLGDAHTLIGEFKMAEGDVSIKG